ncbi:cupin domain-containing protein [Sphingomonas sp. PAMC 26617]|uniref:cupin domain-containing protein n=1 Tax=Sphingomonas sp. PAMC 26617 TaxID=1112216 RepID=UPI00028A027D|nr:cupin domain-containing protein [Sphingomonas sp. PAMC 26617]
MLRRSLLSLPALTVFAPILAQARAAVRAAIPGKVAADADREGKMRAIGLSTTRYKVLTDDTAGALFVLEQANSQKGGPPRHLHHGEDELFFVLEGDYVVEVGEARHWLAPGDCVLGPRGIPHAWAFAGTTPGRLLISFAPAGKMEAFFAQRGKTLKPGQYGSTAQDAAVMRAFGMELIGPGVLPEHLVRPA